MTKKTFKLVCRIDGRLDTLIRMETSHCGHQELADKANRQRTKLLDFIAKEIDELVLKAEPDSPPW